MMDKDGKPMKTAHRKDLSTLVPLQLDVDKVLVVEPWEPHQAVYIVGGKCVTCSGVTIKGTGIQWTVSIKDRGGEDRQVSVNSEYVKTRLPGDSVVPRRLVEVRPSLAPQSLGTCAAAVFAEDMPRASLHTLLGR